MLARLVIVDSREKVETKTLQKHLLLSNHHIYSREKDKLHLGET